MDDFTLLELTLRGFAGLDETDFALSRPYWQVRRYQKGEFFNAHLQVCQWLGFVLDGVFRSFVIEPESGEEKNIFLFSENKFVVSFKSFINQSPCDYHTQAMTDSTTLCIHYTDLMRLYSQSHAWERFGRLAAQAAFQVAIERTESFLFKSPEERYLDLLRDHPAIFQHIPLYHISSYLGIKGPSLSRIRKRLMGGE